MAPKKGRRTVLLSGVALVVVVAVLAWLYGGELRARYLLWRDFESIGLNAQGYPEYRHRETDIVFVNLPGGEFWMGLSKEDAEILGVVRAWEQPRHEVTLTPFLIAKYELSQAEWKQVMGSNPADFEGDNLPVENVSWEDCQEFCRKSGLSLPSEAQWEYACRAGNTGVFCFGDDSSRLGEYAWIKGGLIYPGGEKEPNAFGIYDMHGNVSEWCEDAWCHDFYSRPEATKLDPVCTSGFVERVHRGGGSIYNAKFSRFSYRFRKISSHRDDFLGLRPCYPLR